MAKQPQVPQAFFDEFGNSADDRVMDYGQACYAAGALSAAPQQHGQEVDEVERIGRAFLSVLGDPSIAWRNTGAHEFIERVSQATAKQKSAAHQQPAEAVAEYQYRKPGAHDDSWHRMTQEEYEASLATGHCCGIASWTKNFELRKLYTTPTTDQQPPVAVDLEQFRKPVEFWLAHSEKMMPEMRTTATVEAPRLLAIIDNAPPAIDIGKLRELVERWRVSEREADTQHRKQTGYEIDFSDRARSETYERCADDLAALIGDGGER